MNQQYSSHGIPTSELARPLGLNPESIRTHLCRKGSYFGLKPRRLPNGRLLWPADSVKRLLDQQKEARA